MGEFGVWIVAYLVVVGESKLTGSEIVGFDFSGSGVIWEFPKLNPKP